MPTICFSLSAFRNQKLHRAAGVARFRAGRFCRPLLWKSASVSTSPSSAFFCPSIGIPLSSQLENERDPPIVLGTFPYSRPHSPDSAEALTRAKISYLRQCFETVQNQIGPLKNSAGCCTRRVTYASGTECLHGS